jgi:hypothetical protein
MLQIMTPSHHQWEEFITRLEGPEGCDFQEDGAWKCSCDEDRPFTRAILQTIPNIDIDSTLAYFEECSGFCDCEVAFNVEMSHQSRKSA